MARRMKIECPVCKTQQDVRRSRAAIVVHPNKETGQRCDGSGVEMTGKGIMRTTGPPPPRTP